MEIEEKLNKEFEAFDLSWIPEYSMWNKKIVKQKPKRGLKTDDGLTVIHKIKIKQKPPEYFKCSIINEKEGDKITGILKMFGIYDYQFQTLPTFEITLEFSDAMKFLNLVEKNKKSYKPKL